MREWMLIMFFLISVQIIAQNTINQIDSQGRKQGAWAKKDAQGKLVYQATFKDDKPVGEMKRFHLNGKLNAIINYSEGSEISEAQLFDQSGKPIAKGKYEGKEKTGKWEYLSNGKLVGSEVFLNGKKNGICKRYYNTEKLLEESEWKDGQLHGAYRSYFPEGELFIECEYEFGKRNGAFKTHYPDGVLEMDAFYTENLRDSIWRYFDNLGKLRYSLKFKQGKLLNPEVQDSVDAAYSNSFKTKEDPIPDPENFMQNPDEYLRLIQNK